MDGNRVLESAIAVVENNTELIKMSYLLTDEQWVASKGKFIEVFERMNQAFGQTNIALFKALNPDAE